MLCALLIGFQPSPSADPESRILLDAILARFSQTSPTQISFQVSTPGGRPFVGVYQRMSPQVERYTLTGPGANFEYRHQKGKAIEIDHSDKSYKLWPVSPTEGLLGEGEEWFGASSVPIFLQKAGRAFLKSIPGVKQGPGRTSFSFRQGETSTNYVVNSGETGAVTAVLRTVTTPEGQSITQYKDFAFAPLPAGPATRFSIEPPPRYFPTPMRPFEWPLQNGDTLPTLPGITPSTRLVVFLDPDDSRSNQLVDWLKTRAAWKPKTVFIGLGGSRPHPAIKHWVKPNSPEVLEIGLASLPTLFVIKPGRKIEWVHVGFGPKTRSQVKSELETRLKANS